MTTIPGKRVLVPMRNILNGEAGCRCGCGLKPTDVILVCLQALAYRLERKLGKQIRIEITSMARCPEHNAHEGGVPNSRHTITGKIGDDRPDAADTRWSCCEGGGAWAKLDAAWVAEEAIASGLFGGVGWKQYADSSKILHLDCRPQPLVTW